MLLNVLVPPIPKVAPVDVLVNDTLLYVNPPPMNVTELAFIVIVEDPASKAKLVTVAKLMGVPPVNETALAPRLTALTLVLLVKSVVAVRAKPLVLKVPFVKVILVPVCIIASARFTVPPMELIVIGCVKVLPADVIV